MSAGLHASRVANRYEILASLGEGGMGQVFLAEDSWRARRRIALKLASLDDVEARRALEREFELLRRLRHPNLVTVQDFGACPTSRCAYFTMADSGVPCQAEGGRGRSVADVAALAAAACRALAFVHSRGIVHRDVKAANLLVEREDDREVVRLIDFGLAIPMGESCAGTAFSGTLTHAAPELLDGGAADARTDLYALGVTMHGLHAGKPPFAEDDPLRLAEAHRCASPPSLDAERADLPRGLAALVSALLAKDPSGRPPGALAVIEELARVVGDDAVGAGSSDAADAAAAWARAPRLVARGRPAARARALVLARRGDASPDVDREDSRFLLLDGPAGTGRTTLLDDACALAQVRGAAVLRGRPAGEPWSLFRAPLRDALRGSGVDARNAAPVLAHIDPALHDDGPGAPSDPAAGLSADDVRLAVGRALWDVLVAVPGRSLLALDDVHLADAESCWLLAYLERGLELAGRRATPAPFSVLAAGCVADGGFRAGSDESSERLVPLAAAEIAEAVGLMFPDCDGALELARLVHAQVGGNVALAERWCSALVRSGALATSHGAWVFALDRARALPAAEDLQAPAADALARAPAAVRELARTLAVLPAPVTMASLAEALDAPTSGLERLVDALERRGLAVAPPDPSGRSASMASQAARAAALATMPSEERQRRAVVLHASASLRRELAAADLAELAHAADDSVAVREHLRTALEDCRRRGDHARTVAVASRAAALLDGAEARDALVRQAMALLALDRIDEAAEVARRSAEGVATTGPEAARQAALEGRIALRRGVSKLAVERLRVAVASSATDESTDWELDLARAASLAGGGEAVAILDRMQARLEASDSRDDAQLLRVLIARGADLLRHQRTDEAVASLREALALARRLDARAEEAACENNLGVAALRTGEVAVAARHLRRAIELRLALGARVGAAGTLTNLALLELDRGRPRAALKPAAECLEVQEDVGNLHGELLARLNIGAAHAMREDPASLAAEIGRCRELVARAGDASTRLMLLLVEGELHSLCGRSEEACAAVRAVLTDPDLGATRHEASALLVGAESGDGECRRALAERLDSSALPPGVRAASRLAVIDGLLDPIAWCRPWSVAAARASDVVRARELATRVLDDAERRGPRDVASARLALALADATEGDLEGVRQRLAEIVPAVERGARPSTRVRLSCARGWLAFRDGDLAAAERGFARAMARVARAARHVPSDGLEDFLAAPERAAVRLALLSVRQRRLEAQRDGSYFAPVEDARKQGGRERRASASARAAIERERRHSRRLVEILEISRGINALLPVGELLAQALESAMRFMDADRGFIVLAKGDEIDLAVSRDRAGRTVARAEFSVSRSVLAEVLRTGQAVLSSDARADERFVKQASVLALDLRSVLVAPLVARQAVIGAVYLDNPRASGVFDESDRELLALLASQAAVAVENAGLHATRLDKERLDQDLALARTIQQNLLPKSLPGTPAFRVAAAMDPAREIGGDYYDFIETVDGRLRVAVGDVSGKGVPASLFMVMARTILRAVAATGAPLDVVLAEANDVLESQIEDDKFMTLALLEPAADGRSLRTCLAGHEPPIAWRRATGALEALEHGGLALGMLRGIAHRLEERIVPMAPGDVLVCYSDGVTECRAEDGSMFGRERLGRAVSAAGPGGAEAVLSGILGELERFRGAAERFDDVTLVVLESLGK